jgi:hypothetical protein
VDPVITSRPARYRPKSSPRAPQRGGRRSTLNHRRPRASSQASALAREEQQAYDGEVGDQRDVEAVDWRQARTDEAPGEDRFYACPLYKLNPVKYEGCLHRAGIQTPSYVVQHLNRQHKPPIYCPTCGETFGERHGRDPKTACDAHINERKCERRAFTCDGLQPEQLVRVAQLPRNSDGKDKWYQIWDALFPGRRRPSSPFVSKSAFAEFHDVIALVYPDRAHEITWEETQSRFAQRSLLFDRSQGPSQCPRHSQQPPSLLLRLPSGSIGEGLNQALSHLDHPDDANYDIVGMDPPLVGQPLAMERIPHVALRQLEYSHPNFDKEFDPHAVSSLYVPHGSGGSEFVDFQDIDLDGLVDEDNQFDPAG